MAPVRADGHRSARESLGHRLAETLRRHEEETNSLRTKQADEIRLLEAKQADIEALDALIERFAGEFQSTGIAYGPSALDATAGSEVSGDSADDGQDEPAENDTAEATTPIELSLPEEIAVRYTSPNFLRKFAS